MLAKARSGTVFHKSTEWLLLKEKGGPHLLNDDDSTSCSGSKVRQDSKITLLGRSLCRTIIKKELAGN